MPLFDFPFPAFLRSICRLQSWPGLILDYFCFLGREDYSTMTLTSNLQNLVVDAVDVVEFKLSE